MSRLLRWWRDRKRVVGECECSAQLTRRQRHLVVATFDDDDELAGGSSFGSTAMSADFCGRHCPGGCDRGCVAA